MTGSESKCENKIRTLHVATMRMSSCLPVLGFKNSKPSGDSHSKKNGAWSLDNGDSRRASAQMTPIQRKNGAGAFIMETPSTPKRIIPMYRMQDKQKHNTLV